MKQIYFKFSMLLVCMVMGLGSAMAQETYTFSFNGNGVNVSNNMTFDNSVWRVGNATNCAISSNAIVATGSNAGKNGTAGSVTLTASNFKIKNATHIQSVKLTFGEVSNASCTVTVGSETLTTTTKELDNASVAYTTSNGYPEGDVKIALTTDAGKNKNIKITLKSIEIVAYEMGSFSISSVGWGTYYTNKEFVMPDSVEGYFVSTSATTAKVTLTKVINPGITVPAGTPLLIKSTEDLTATKTFEYIVTNTNASPILAENCLYGNLNAGTVNTIPGATQYYKLMNGSKGLGWYLGAENGGVFNLGANKAYLALSGQVNLSKAFTIDEIATAINEVEVKENTNGVIYNLAGQRIASPVSGQMYIKNGKKYYAK